MAVGCELLSILFRYYATGSSAEVLIGLKTMQKYTLKGDAIEGLQKSWVMVLSGFS